MDLSFAPLKYARICLGQTRSTSRCLVRELAVLRRDGGRAGQRDADVLHARGDRLALSAAHEAENIIAETVRIPFADHPLTLERYRED